jgi:hypothetical protein
MSSQSDVCVFVFPLHLIETAECDDRRISPTRLKLAKFTPSEVSASANYDKVHFVDIKFNGDSGVYSLFFLSTALSELSRLV